MTGNDQFGVSKVEFGNANPAILQLLLQKVWFLLLSIGYNVSSININMHILKSMGIENVSSQFCF